MAKIAREKEKEKEKKKEINNVFPPNKQDQENAFENNCKILNQIDLFSDDNMNNISNSNDPMYFSFKNINGNVINNNSNNNNIDIKKTGNFCQDNYNYFDDNNKNDMNNYNNNNNNIYNEYPSMSEL